MAAQKVSAILATPTTTHRAPPTYPSTLEMVPQQAEPHAKTRSLALQLQLDHIAVDTRLQLKGPALTKQLPIFGFASGFSGVFGRAFFGSFLRLRYGCGEHGLGAVGVKGDCKDFRPLQRLLQALSYSCHVCVLSW